MSTNPDLTAFLASFSRLAELAAEQHQRARDRGAPKLLPVLAAHLGVDPLGLPVVTEDVTALRAVDADVALTHVIEARGGGELLGIGGGEQRWHTSLSEILQHAAAHHMFPIGAVDYRHVPVGPEAERSVVAFGLHLFRVDGAPVAVLQRAANPQFGAAARLEVLAPGEGVATALLAELREAMTTHSVLRGQVVTFAPSEYDPSLGGVTFQRRPHLNAEDIVLPADTLARIERHVIGIGRHRAQLASAGQHLKRGVLLYGPPGTGKTLTVRYLVSAAQDATVILLSGAALQLIGLAAATARALQPAIVVLEDCDLVAEERSHFHSSPLLFEVLDALDGLAADSDVTFLLTTNRVDILEPALAQRPGRVDLAVEIPLPDAAARRALLDLYAGSLAFSPEVLDEVAASAEGITASFVKELVRRAVLLAAEAGSPEPVGDDQLRAALAQMMSDGGAITRAVLGASGMGGEGDEDLEGWSAMAGYPHEAEPGVDPRAFSSTFRMEFGGAASGEDA